MKKVNPKSLAACFIVMLCLTGAAITQQLSQKDKPEGILTRETNLPVVTDRYTGTRALKNSLSAGRVSNALPDTIFPDIKLYLDLRTIDTTLFAGRFRKIATVPVGAAFMGALIFDSNDDGVNEIIGFHVDTTIWPAKNQFYQQHQIRERFDLVADFNAPTIIEGGAAYLGSDIDQDGLKEVIFGYGDSLRIYESPAPGQYATKSMFRFSKDSDNVTRGIATGDFDRDGNNELLFITLLYDSIGTPIDGAARFMEYRPSDGRLVQSAEIIYPNSGDSWGSYALGDLDLDGHLEFVTGHFSGRLLGLENVANDSFRINWEAQLPTLAVYANFTAGDLDGNGRPEFFVCGHKSVTFSEVHNLIVAFETTGDDQYAPVWAADIISGSPFHSRTVAHGDVDGDGIDEFTFDLETVVVTFKVAGKKRFEVLWAKEFPGAAEGVAMGDLNGDGLSEIVLSSRFWNPDIQRFESISEIYKYDPPVGISHRTPPTANVIEISNFPNPFNQSTTIKYKINQNAHIQLKIFNINGEEVITLIHDRQTAGIYSLKWNGINQFGKEVSSGLYVVQLSAGQERHAQKILLLR